MVALFSLSTCIFSFYISLDVFAQGSARCASTRAGLESHNISISREPQITFSWLAFSLQAFYLSGGFLRGTPLSEAPQTCGP